MRAVVTGATGFVGSHLARALVEAGHDVVCLRRLGSRTDLIDGLPVAHAIADLAGPPEAVERAIADARPDAVFHVAGAYSIWEALHPRLYRVNVLGTRAVVRACERLGRGVRLVKTGSCVAYCGTREAVVCTEDGTDDLTRWRSFHVVSMALAEREVLEAAARGLHAVQVHPGLVLGEGDIHYHAAWIFAAAARSRFYGPGGMNLVDVRDVVRAHILAFERGRSGESYLIGGENLAHGAVLAAAEEVVGRGARTRVELGRLPMRVLGAIGEVAGRLRGDDERNRLALNATGAELGSLYWWFSSAKAERDLGWRAGPVRPAMERAWTWLEERFARRRAARAGATTPAAASSTPASGGTTRSS
jgi:dihydroflavonol-4-reductase